jgi:hypothetical protein
MIANTLSFSRARRRGLYFVLPTRTHKYKERSNQIQISSNSMISSIHRTPCASLTLAGSFGVLLRAILRLNPRLFTTTDGALRNNISLTPSSCFVLPTRTHKYKRTSNPISRNSMISLIHRTPCASQTLAGSFGVLLRAILRLNPRLFTTTDGALRNNTLTPSSCFVLPMRTHKYKETSNQIQISSNSIVELCVSLVTKSAQIVS